jgi:hypothetical protein
MKCKKLLKVIKLNQERLEMKNENSLWSGRNVPVKDVARIMKKDEQFIRLALQSELLPIGFAMKKGNSSQYDYYVSPKLLYEYTGYVYSGPSKE